MNEAFFAGLPGIGDVRAELARRDLLEYARLQWPKYDVGNHHRIIADALQRVEAGLCKRLMIFAPPRSGKSMLTSEFFPAWYLGRNPESYIIHATYAQELADDWGRKIRNQLADDLFPFSNCQLSRDSASQKKFNTTLGGAYFALGVGGAATGRGAHLLLIDDPLKGREDADSETIRRKLKDWYRAVAYTRLMPGGAIIVMLTRWHYDDLAGWLLRDHASEGWEVINLPAITEAGEALWPEHFPLERLAEIKEQLGSREWSALYMQEPSPDEGTIFNLEWFRRYRTAPHSENIHSWDTGTKDEDIHDPSVMECWRSADTGYYLVDVFRKRMQFPELRRAVESLAVRDNPSAILIEDRGSGHQLIQVLRAETSLPIIAVPAVQSKLSRAQGVSGTVEAGRVYLPESALWLVDFESEVQSFPVGANDDQVDSMSQGLRYMIDKNAVKPKDDQQQWQQIPEAGAL